MGKTASSQGNVTSELYIFNFPFLHLKGRVANHAQPG